MFVLALNAILGCDSPRSLSRIGKRKYSRHLKRKLMSQQICMTLVSSNHCLWNALPWLLLFSSFALCTKRTKQLQISMNYDMKYLQKGMCLKIDCLQLFHAEWTVKYVFASQHGCLDWTYRHQLEMDCKWKVWISVKSLY